MTLIFSFLFSLFYFYITWRRFEHGLFLFFLLLPTYLIRFSLFGIPTTLLEVMFGLLCIVYVAKRIKNKRYDTQDNNQKQNPISYLLSSIFSFYTQQTFLFWSITLFLLGATISIFTSVDIRTALGEWKAFYVEPVILFTILIIYESRKQKVESSDQNSYILHSTFYILTPLLLCGLITSILAIYQHFTGWMVPHAFWANRETYRVTAWYGFPNGVGLFLAPLVPLALFYVKNIYSNKAIGRYRNISQYIAIHRTPIISTLFLLTSLPAILFAKSTGAIIGIAAGIGFLLLVHKKTRGITLVVGLVGLVVLWSFPNLKPIRDEITFQDRSGQIRLAIYDETLQLLKDRPLLGAGLASYEERIAPYHQKVNGESIEIFHHPHNIFLTMWVNTGLIGMIGFVGIIVWCFRKSYEVTKLRSYQKLPITNYQLLITNYTTASLITLLVAGLVDSPYIKNDLAFLFWTILALIYINIHTDRQDAMSTLQ